VQRVYRWFVPVDKSEYVNVLGGNWKTKHPVLSKVITFIIMALVVGSALAPILFFAITMPGYVVFAVAPLFFLLLIFIGVYRFILTDKQRDDFKGRKGLRGLFAKVIGTQLGLFILFLVIAGSGGGLLVAGVIGSGALLIISLVLAILVVLVALYKKVWGNSTSPAFTKKDSEEGKPWKTKDFDQLGENSKDGFVYERYLTEEGETRYRPVLHDKFLRKTKGFKFKKENGKSKIMVLSKNLDLIGGAHDTGIFQRSIYLVESKGNAKRTWNSVVLMGLLSLLIAGLIIGLILAEIEGAGIASFIAEIFTEGFSTIVFDSATLSEMAQSLGTAFVDVVGSIGGLSQNGILPWSIFGAGFLAIVSLVLWQYLYLNYIFARKYKKGNNVLSREQALEEAEKQMVERKKMNSIHIFISVVLLIAILVGAGFFIAAGGTISVVTIPILIVPFLLFVIYQVFNLVIRAKRKAFPRTISYEDKNREIQQLSLESRRTVGFKSDILLTLVMATLLFAPLLVPVFSSALHVAIPLAVMLLIMVSIYLILFANDHKKMGKSKGMLDLEEEIKIKEDRAKQENIDAEKRLTELQEYDNLDKHRKTLQQVRNRLESKDASQREKGEEQLKAYISIVDELQELEGTVSLQMARAATDEDSSQAEDTQATYKKIANILKIVASQDLIVFLKDLLDDQALKSKIDPALYRQMRRYLAKDIFKIFLTKDQAASSSGLSFKDLHPSARTLIRMLKGTKKVKTMQKVVFEEYQKKIGSLLDGKVDQEQIALIMKVSPKLLHDNLKSLRDAVLLAQKKVSKGSDAYLLLGEISFLMTEERDPVMYNLLRSRENLRSYVEDLEDFIGGEELEFLIEVKQGAMEELTEQVRAIKVDLNQLKQSESLADLVRSTFRDYQKNIRKANVATSKELQLLDEIIDSMDSWDDLNNEECAKRLLEEMGRLYVHFDLVVFKNFFNQLEKDVLALWKHLFLEVEDLIDLTNTLERELANQEVNIYVEEKVWEQYVNFLRSVTNRVSREAGFRDYFSSRIDTVAREYLAVAKDRRIEEQNRLTINYKDELPNDGENAAIDLFVTRQAFKSGDSQWKHLKKFKWREGENIVFAFKKPSDRARPVMEVLVVNSHEGKLAVPRIFTDQFLSIARQLFGILYLGEFFQSDL
jgi:MFS family permease